MKTDFKNSCRGLTLIEVTIIIAVIAILGAMILPALTRPRMRRAPRINCVNNLRQIELAFKTWSVDCSDWFDFQAPLAQGGTKELITNGLAYFHFQAMSNELSAPKILVCPTDKGKTAARSFGPGDFGNSNVSYFVNVDAADVYPQRLLVGDRNLSMEGVAVKPGMLTITTNSVLGWTKELHMVGGNVGLGDGSVMQVTSLKLQTNLHVGNFETNRLLVP